MGNRLSHIYTRTGDQGTTGLANKMRVAKSDLRIELIGTTDELNCQLGVLRCFLQQEELTGIIDAIQHKLFDLGSEFALSGRHTIQAEDVMQLEQWIDHYNETLPRLRDFILPGGSVAAAHWHLARSVCRRLERLLVRVAAESEIQSTTASWVNRLSDLFFVLARYQNVQDQHTEIVWNGGRCAQS